MDEKQLELLIETAERAKVNAKDIKEVKQTLEGQNEILKTVREIATEIKYMRRDYETLAKTHEKEVTALDKRIEDIEKKPAKKFEQIEMLILTGTVTAVLGYILGHIGF